MFAVLFLAAFQTCSAGLWSGAYGGRKIVVMRSSSRPGSWRPVNALAWWNRALSKTTAISPASVSRWSHSSAPIVCSVFWFPSIGYGLTFLLVSERAPKKDWDVLRRSTDRSGALSSGGLHAAGPGLVLGAGLSLAVWAFQPWSDKLLTRVVAQAARLVVAGSSWR